MNCWTRIAAQTALLAMGVVATGMDAQAQAGAQGGASDAAATALQAVAQAGTKPVALNGADTAWMLICTVLVMLMTIPGIILFYGGMLRSKNALSIVAHTVAGAAVVTLVWAMVAYTIAFSPGNGYYGDLSHAFASGLIGPLVGAHPVAPTVPESVFFLFQLAFAVITFALILGSTAERMKLSVTIMFAALWVVLVYAPVAHWVWQPSGWLSKMGHMDFAGGTVVHIVSGASGLVAAWVVGPRRGFGKEPMVPHNLLITVLGAGLLWAGWFGFNAGSAFEASSRAAGALLATQVAACAGAMAWGFCEYLKRGQWSVLGMMTGAIAGLIGVTPASGFVGLAGAFAIGAITGVICCFTVLAFKARTGLDDTLDVFALHGMGGFVGTMLTPVFAVAAIAPVTATVFTNLTGALAVMAYSAVVTWFILKFIAMFTKLRVTETEEKVGLDISQHGEMLSPHI
jgi:ammonium transporter, Amt family